LPLNTTALAVNTHLFSESNDVRVSYAGNRLLMVGNVSISLGGSSK
jgi:hypothetical protein